MPPRIPPGSRGGQRGGGRGGPPQRGGRGGADAGRGDPTFDLPSVGGEPHMISCDFSPITINCLVKSMSRRLA